MKIRIDLTNDNIKALAAQLANEDDATQAMFIRAFLDECRTWGPNCSIERQLNYIRKHLHPTDITLLRSLTDESDAEEVL